MTSATKNTNITEYNTDVSKVSVEAPEPLAELLIVFGVLNEGVGDVEGDVHWSAIGETLQKVGRLGSGGLDHHPRYDVSMMERMSKRSTYGSESLMALLSVTCDVLAVSSVLLSETCRGSSGRLPYPCAPAGPFW